MEQKKLIDYSALKWFDCKSNFPPMHIDLYVDSEHGFGIGRLGKRVKDGSTIWSVHLDSGEVYLVYAFYKVKRWAYMPKEEETNANLKHELKPYIGPHPTDHTLTEYYLKSEADKVIVEQATLRAWAELQLRHQKYKRCLAMAKWCNDKINAIKNGYMVSSINTQYGVMTTCPPECNPKFSFYKRWYKRWLELADKFKEAN